MVRTNVEEEAAMTELHVARRDLLAVLEELNPDDWDKPTLCAGWRVREVVSHIAAAPDTKLVKSLVGRVKSRGDASAAQDLLARKLGMRPVDEILDHYRSNVDSTSLPPSVHPDRLLADVVIHSLDICEPNGWDLALPADRIRTVLSKLVTLGAPFKGRDRAVGLHFDTTDIDWRCGCGEDVRGPSRAMVLALAGRRPMCDQLTGDGVATLAAS